uniref:FAD dependent oxidoreductase domain-containing protein n=1 Tax=Helicotheca tamesis TaxID=374047 RepID=A0A7S2IFQ8_9STRA|mmetsp:Transcript_874/g.1190  ORF Transcript_874/g.1190 Transcript_874/m.1190 type:complete len:544 (+) Transcript_874:278-1909(+)
MQPPEFPKGVGQLHRDDINWTDTGVFWADVCQTEEEGEVLSPRDHVPAFNPDKDSSSYDVVVVGAGYSGLSTARELAKACPSLSICLLEADYCGYGASARNSGFLNASCVYHDPHQLLKTLGVEKGKKVAEFARSSVQNVKDMIEENKIECDLDKDCGIAYPAIDDAQMKHAKEMAKAAEMLGSPSGEIWDEATAVEKLGSTLFKGAWLDPTGSHVNPFKLVRGLLKKTVLCHDNVNYFEHTRLAGYPRRAQKNKSTPVEGNGHSTSKPRRLLVPIETKERGQMEINADAVFLCTNAYSEGPLSKYYCPLHVYTIVTEPLSEKQLELLGKGKAGWYSLHHILFAFRRTADNRLLVSSGDVRYYRKDKRHVRNSPHTYQFLRDALAWFYPELANVAISNAWEGVVAGNFDDQPTVGRGSHPYTYHALGYAGHGVALANSIGKVLKDLYLQDTGELPKDEATKYTSLPFVCKKFYILMPGEPFRKLIDIAYVNILRWLDGFNNKRVARAERLEQAALSEKEGLLIPPRPKAPWATLANCCNDKAD